MANFEIYQVKRQKMREFAFESFEMAEHYNGVGSVVFDNYKKVGEFDADAGIGLDAIFEACNFRSEAAYKDAGMSNVSFEGHSMSVSDVVKTPDGFFYCDSFGWKKLDWGGSMKSAGYDACREAIEKAMYDRPIEYDCMTVYFDSEKLEAAKSTYGYDLYKEVMEDLNWGRK